ncbi:MAG: MFS transporter [Chitinophagales bacterium]|nr:MFS transporter [Chitinophagales bacterium]
MINRKAILNLFAANTISGMSQGISLIAIPWYVANELNLPDAYGYLILTASVLSLFWGSYAGTLVDKFNRKNIMLVLQIVGLAIILSISILGFVKNHTTIIMAGLVMIVTKMIYNIHYPNLYAFAQEITEEEHYGRINSWIEIQGQTTFMLAGAAAAFLMEGKFFNWHFEPWHIHEIFMIDAITYIIGLFFIYRIKYVSLVDRKNTGKNSYHKRMTEGLKFLLDNQLILLFGAMAGFVFAASLICSTYTLPIFINKFLHANESTYGITEASFALGSLLSGFIILKLFKKNQLILGIIILGFLASALFFGMGLTKSTLFLFAAYCVIGFTNAGIRVMRNTYMFRVINNNMIGRTGSIFMVINSLLRILLILIFSSSFFKNGENIEKSMWVLALFIAIGSFILLFNFKGLKQLNPSNE